MQILITGGAGFIGSSLADKLIQEHEIIVVDNFNDYYDVALKEQNVAQHKDNTKHKIYRIDIEDKQALTQVFKENQIDVIVHLAGRAGVRPSLELPDEYVKSNILATVYLLELMKDYGVKKMVYASSSSVYGNCTEEIFSEDLKITEPILYITVSSATP